MHGILTRAPQLAVMTVGVGVSPPHFISEWDWDGTNTAAAPPIDGQAIPAGAAAGLVHRLPPVPALPVPPLLELDPNPRYLTGAAPLHRATATGHVSAEVWLLGHPRINVSARDAHGYTGLDLVRDGARASIHAEAVGGAREVDSSEAGGVEWVTPGIHGGGGIEVTGHCE